MVICSKCKRSVSICGCLEESLVATQEMISHEEALNFLLANTCPMGHEDNLFFYELDLHCERVKVTAILREILSIDQDLEYDIVSIEKI